MKFTSILSTAKPAYLISRPPKRPSDGADWAVGSSVADVVEHEVEVFRQAEAQALAAGDTSDNVLARWRDAIVSESGRIVALVLFRPGQAVQVINIDDGGNPSKAIQVESSEGEGEDDEEDTPESEDDAGDYRVDCDFQYHWHRHRALARDLVGDDVFVEVDRLAERDKAVIEFVVTRNGERMDALAIYTYLPDNRPGVRFDFFFARNAIAAQAYADDFVKEIPAWFEINDAVNLTGKWPVAEGDIEVVRLIRATLVRRIGLGPDDD